jgi:hypothetical protein
MGNTYKNVTVRRLGHEALAQALRGREAYLSPQSGEHVVVYDRDADETPEPGELVELAKRLASASGVAALAAAVYDEDVLLLWAAEGAEVVFRYDSSVPGEPDVETLCRNDGARGRARRRRGGADARGGVRVGPASAAVRGAVLADLGLRDGLRVHRWGPASSRPRDRRARPPDVTKSHAVRAASSR